MEVQLFLSIFGDDREAEKVKANFNAIVCLFFNCFLSELEQAETNPVAQAVGQLEPAAGKVSHFFLLHSHFIQSSSTIFCTFLFYYKINFEQFIIMKNF